MLNELLQSASVVYARDHGQEIPHSRYLRFLLRNSLYCRYSSREKLFSIAEIDQNMRLQWPRYPVFNSTSPGPGKYGVFEDFRAARTDHTPLQISFDAADSVYRVRFLNNDSFGVGDYWGITDGRDAYLKIGPNAFLKLSRQDSTFVFFVPHTMPDIWTQLTPADVGYPEPESINFVPSEPNILGALAAVLIVGAIHELMEKHWEKKVAKNLQQVVSAPPDLGYRYGWLEMNTGDILYKKGGSQIKFVNEH
jgi:hypothetical protein